MMNDEPEEVLKADQVLPPQKTGAQRKAEALIPYHWKKGQSGNPGGKNRNNKKILTRYLMEFLEANDNEKAKQLAQAVVLQAAKGNGVALKIVFDRVEGLLEKMVDVQSGGELIIRIARDNPALPEPSSGADEDTEDERSS